MAIFSYKNRQLFLFSLFALVSIFLFPSSVYAESDPKIASVSANTTSTEKGAMVDYVFTMETTETLLAGATFSVFFTATDVVPQSIGYNFQATTFSSGTILGTAQAIAEYNYAFLTVTLSSELAPGSYSFTLGGVANPNADVSMYPTITSEMLAESNRYTVAENSITIGTGSTQVSGCQDVGEISGLEVKVFGTNASLSWDAYEEAVFYTLNWTTEEGELSGETVRGITDTNYLIEGLDPKTTYTIDLFADLATCVGAATATETIQTKKDVTKMLFAKPKVPRKKITQKSVLIRWKTSPVLSAITLQLFQGKKELAVYKNIDASDGKVLLKGLHAGTRYAIRMKATYITDETSKYSKKKKFRTLKNAS